MRRKVLMAAVLFITVWLLWEAEALREAAREGLALCAGSVIPALFPFLAVSSLLLKLGFGDALAGPLAPLMGLYRLPGEAAGALALGLAGGYPVGARTAAELCAQGALTQDEAERLLTFCNNANPAFLLSGLGLGVLGSVRAGLWLWLIHVLSALVTGLVLARRPGRQGGGRARPRKDAISEGSFPELLVGAVQGALGAILGICAFVELFYVLGLPLRRLPAPWGAGLAGAVELFSASAGLPGGRLGFVLAAGLAGFGGLSVLCQTAAVLAPQGLSPAPCFRGKLLQGALSAALAAALAPWVMG